jgi:hypothetical protein
MKTAGGEFFAFGKVGKSPSSVRDSFGLVRSTSYRASKQLHQARLVRITSRTLAIWLDPIGMLDPQIIVNFLQQVCVGAEFVGHGHIDSVEDSSGPREDAFFKATTESSTGDDAMRAPQNHRVKLFRSNRRTCWRCARR